MEIRTLTVFGTRPETIKMVPVVRALASRNEIVVNRVCITAQHRGMLDQMLESFSLRADYDLNVMMHDQSPMEVAARVLKRFEQVLRLEEPEWILVQGDTTTTMAAALAASYWGVNVGHIEAGLRTYNKSQPFPEEINRTITSSVADLHFAPTENARDNLIREGVDERKIIVTGNPVIDALFQTLTEIEESSSAQLPREIPRDRRLIFVTAHRRENFGDRLRDICNALLDIAEQYPESVHIVYPVHPNPNVRRVVHTMLGSTSNVTLLEPLDYQSCVRMMQSCDLILTDSGGIQEEAPSLGKPVLVLRDLTERPESIMAGTARLVGTKRSLIVQETIRLIESRQAYAKMAKPINIYGDGQAASRIVSALMGETVVNWAPEFHEAKKILDDHGSLEMRNKVARPRSGSK